MRCISGARMGRISDFNKVTIFFSLVPRVKTYATELSFSERIQGLLCASRPKKFGSGTMRILPCSIKYSTAAALLPGSLARRRAIRWTLFLKSESIEFGHFLSCGSGLREIRLHCGRPFSEARAPISRSSRLVESSSAPMTCINVSMFRHL